MNWFTTERRGAWKCVFKMVAVFWCWNVVCGTFQFEAVALMRSAGGGHGFILVSKYPCKECLPNNQKMR